MKTALLCLMSVQPETPVVTAKLYSNYKFFEQLILGTQFKLRFIVSI